MASIVRVLALLFFAGMLRTQSAAAQCDLQVLEPVQPQSFLHYGRAIALSGDVGVIGAIGDADVDVLSGAVHMLRRAPDGTWNLEQILRRSGPSPSFKLGFSVATDGQRVVAGSPGAEYLPAPGPGGEFNAGNLHGPEHGEVQVYRYTAGAWSPERVLLPAHLGPGARLGRACAIDGATMLASAPLKSTAGLFFHGALYIYTYAQGLWSVSQTLTDPAGLAFDRFGSGLALDGNRLLVTSAPTQGLARILAYERNAGQWALDQVLPNLPQAADTDLFGPSLALDGDWAVAGLLRATVVGLAEAGQVQIYQRMTNGWLLRQVLSAPDPEAVGYFGFDVALEGTRLVVGASAVNGARGATYEFERIGTSFQFRRRFDAPAGFAVERFGDHLALEGEHLWVRSRGNNAFFNDGGRVYAMDLASHVSAFCHCDITPTCANPDPVAGCGHSGGAGAELAACGTTSLLADDLVLRATELPPATLGTLLLGDSTDLTPLGGGSLCVGHAGGVPFAFLPAAGDVNGVWSVGPGLLGLTGQRFGAAAAPLAGATWNVQLWYTSPNGSCATGSNLTNALALTFVP